MEKSKKNLLWNTIIFSLIVVIAVCFVGSMAVIENYAKEDCLEHIEESTVQMTDMFKHTMNQSRTQLTMFADILASNIGGNTPELLAAYMKNFCSTQNFAAVCIHRMDGTSVSHGVHPHDMVSILSFDAELKKLPYVSGILSMGEKPSEKYIYDAVAVNNSSGETVAVLYGYISLDTLPSFISSAAYDGSGRFCIVDGDSGDVLMNEYEPLTDSQNEPLLGNIFDDDKSYREIKDGYSLRAMNDDIGAGRAGYFVFKPQNENSWYYTYYMPIGINNWSMQMTIDENTAFASYAGVSDTVLSLMVCVILFIVSLILILLIQSAKARRKDEMNLHKADYINSVQSALISAHNNPDFVDKALRIVGEEMWAETVLLLTFSDKTVSGAQYWPSKDKTQAMAMIGINIRDAFPAIFDALSSGNSVCYDASPEDAALSESAAELLQSFDVANMILVPINDNTGVLKGAIVAVNVPADKYTPEMLEYVTRDFFMAMTNLENHNIIKRMGAIDYLTGLKNRNSYESELSNYEVSAAENLWCIFVDANGLHELNNKMGHKAGDLMLCTVADTLRKIYGANHTYRLGGDEFLAFRTDSTHEELMASKYRLLDELSRKGYSVSVGFECVCKNENNVFDVERCVSAAETIMYRDKRKYYEINNISEERGRFPVSDTADGE